MSSLSLPYLGVWESPTSYFGVYLHPIYSFKYQHLGSPSLPPNFTPSLIQELRDLHTHLLPMLLNAHGILSGKPPTMVAGSETSVQYSRSLTVVVNAEKQTMCPSLIISRVLSHFGVCRRLDGLQL